MTRFELHTFVLVNKKFTVILREGFSAKPHTHAHLTKKHMSEQPNRRIQSMKLF